MIYPADDETDECYSPRKLYEKDNQRWQPSTLLEYLDQFEKKPHFKVGDRVEIIGMITYSGENGEITEVSDNYCCVKLNGFQSAFNIKYLIPYTPPKFDPNTADKSKMYFAVHPEYGDGVVLFDYNLSNWMYESSKKSTTAPTCTHIDHEPIQQRN
jgi:hypothetical protein